MMRFFRTLPLFALLVGLPFLLNATCVTRVDQKGPTGPWIGQVVNSGSTAEGAVQVSAVVVDATGKEVIEGTASVCPNDLQPGETGTFSLDLPWYLVSFPSLYPPPFSAVFRPIATSLSQPRPPLEGINIRLVSIDAVHRAIVAEIQNTSSKSYDAVTVCANIRGTFGELLAVGSGKLFPVTLAGGETRTVPLYFGTLPSGNYEFFANGTPYSGGRVFLNGTTFRATASRVRVSQNGSISLLVVGEVENNSGLDLGGVQLQAFLNGSGTVQIIADAGCAGIIGKGGKGPAMLIVPLDTPTASGVSVSGIQAAPITGVSPIQMKDVVLQSQVEDQVFVRASLSNPSESYLQIDGICFNLRDSAGRLVGTSNEDHGGAVPPGSTWVINGGITEVAKGTTVEAIAYGHTIEGTPTPVVGPPLS